MCNKHNSIIVPLCKPRRNSKLSYAKVDSCIAPVVLLLNILGIETLGACCGHGKYNPSIIIDFNGKSIDIFSEEIILRKKRFYYKDKSNLYYIPEIKNKKRGR